MRIALEILTKIDLEFFERSIPLRVTRLHAYASFLQPNGWSRPRIGIIDTGSPISVLPPKLWKSLNAKLLTPIPSLFYGVGEGAAPLRGQLGEVQCVFQDDKSTSPPLRLKAHLIENDVAPILFGFEDILTQADLVVRHRNNEAYLEF